jgi:uncharacterized paraquat-inducible protein A
VLLKKEENKMVKVMLNVLLIIVFVSAFTLTAYAENKYVGATNCKMCHSSKKSGAAYKIWEASAHAKAYETLASEESKEIADKKGIKNPQEAAECLSCHITGYGKPASAFDKKYAKEEGVTCEACHGPGSAYNSMKVMKQIAAGEVKGADYGLQDPDEALCKTCHNEKSPTFKGFKYAEFVEKIAHPTPEPSK